MKQYCQRIINNLFKNCLKIIYDLKTMINWYIQIYEKHKLNIVKEINKLLLFYHY